VDETGLVEVVEGEGERGTRVVDYRDEVVVGSERYCVSCRGILLGNTITTTDYEEYSNSEKLC